MPSLVRPFAMQGFGRLRMNTHPTQLAPGETHSMLNIDYSVPFARTKRPGYAKQYNDSLGTGAIRGMATYDPRVGDTKEFVWWSTKAYVESAGALVESLTGLTAGTVDSLQINNMLFFLNGTDRKRWNGTSWFPWGVSAPGSALSAAVGAAGVLDGDYYYKVVFENNAGGLSNPSAASTIVSPSSQQNNLTSIPTGAAGTDVAKRRIYRTEADNLSTGNYYLVTTINNNTTTTYTDNTADTALGAKLETDNDPCPAGTFCFTWNARAWVGGVATNPQRLYPSKILRPEQFEISLEIEASDGQSATAGIDFGDCALIGKERGIYRIRGDVSTPQEVVPGLQLFEIKALNSHVGPVNSRVFKRVGAFAMLLSAYEGVWCVITANDTDGMPNVVDAGEDIRPILKTITSPEDAHAYVNDNKYILHCKVLEGSATVKYELICDFSRSSPLEGIFAWEVNRKANGLSCYHRRTDGYLYAGDDTNGFVYKMKKHGDSTPYADNGSLIDAYFYVPDMDFSHILEDAGVRDKLIPKLWVTARRWDAATTMDVTPIYNGTPGKVVSVPVNEAVDAMDDMTLGGSMDYETNRVDLTEQVDVAEPLFKHWGCLIRNNTLNQGLTIYKLGGEVRFLPAR